MDLVEAVTVLVLIGAFMATVAGANLAIRWTNRRFSSDAKVSERLAAMEQRLAELEERMDFAERSLTAQRSREQLPP